MNAREGEELAEIAGVGFERQRRHAALAGKMPEPGLREAGEFGVGLREWRRVGRRLAGKGGGGGRHWIKSSPGAR